MFLLASHLATASAWVLLLSVTKPPHELVAQDELVLFCSLHVLSSGSSEDRPNLHSFLCCLPYREEDVRRLSRTAESNKQVSSLSHDFKPASKDCLVPMVICACCKGCRIKSVGLDSLHEEVIANMHCICI